jgi:hypothetical protein
VTPSRRRRARRRRLRDLRHHDSPLPAAALDSPCAALATVALMGVRGRGPVPRAGRPTPAGPGAPATNPPPGAPTSGADRAALVDACIYVRDRVTSRALAERLGGALRTAGVRILEPTGVRFDAAVHEAGGTAPTTDPAVAGTIAAVEVPGYADRDGRLLRAPVVTVYRISDNAHGELR